jgi:predicted NUDIX family NTP pyrophosphohydrolase
VPRRSAALLVYRRRGEDEVEVLIGHMGGPFWARKDARAWSIPKGEYDGSEAPLAAARREFEEETGSPAPAGPVTDLGELRQPGGKVIVAYAVEGDLDLSGFRSNTFTLEWPRGSGQVREFPELDRVAWMSLGRASEMLVKGQVAILGALRAHLQA